MLLPTPTSSRLPTVIIMSNSASMPVTPDETNDAHNLSAPGSPSSEMSSEASTPLDDPSGESPAETHKRFPSLNSIADSRPMHSDTTAVGMLGKARNPNYQSSFVGSAGAPMGNDVLAKARALQQQRMHRGLSPAQSLPVSPAPQSPAGTSLNGFPGNLRMGCPPQRPGPGGHPKSAPTITKQSLSERRANKAGAMGMKLSNMGGGSPTSTGRLQRLGAPKLSDITGTGSSENGGASEQGSKMDDFKKYIDAEKGWITFDGAATITRTGVNFSNGQTFSISLDEIQILGELGKGNYGTVYKVKHARPVVPRFGHGLSGAKQTMKLHHTISDPGPVKSTGSGPCGQGEADGTTGMTMAMKEIRLELDDAKFTTILKELVILHECVSPYIIDFYGAFFQEGAVYICIEWMDGGSLDRLYTGGIPEAILRKITYSTVMGLKSLKDDHNIIHRDVKPTNVLVNTRGQVKICDFGVSGNLVASIAKTNIGCQSYMAPERISGGGMAPSGNADGTYSVQSDIWSLGLTVIECALGRYPYPPEISSTIFSQLNVSRTEKKRML